MTRGHRTQRGFLLPALVWVLVILAGIVAGLAQWLVQGSAAIGQEVRSARALAAARAGTEWAAWQVRDPNGTLAPGASALPACPASPATLALPAPLDAFNVQVVCTRTPATGAIDEGGLQLAFYDIVATAGDGPVDSAERVERRVQVRIETCKNPTGSAPYRC